MTQIKKASPAQKDIQETKEETALEQVLIMLKSQDEKFDKLSKRMGVLEGGKLDFKAEATDTDIKNATRQNIQPEICEIVDETLGEDFDIRMNGFKDRPGFLFELIVPQRLSLLKEQTRPIKGEDGKYIQTAEGNNEMETYKPDDVRAKTLSTIDSYDAVREYCVKVRQNLTMTYEKLKRPLPPLSIK